MASGAGHSADFGTPGTPRAAEVRADGHGRSPMQATPVMKRAGAGSSPTKRASRRVAPAPSTEVVPNLDQPQLVVEVHKLFRQSQKDQESFDGITEALNQHASRIDDTKSDMDLLMSDVKLVAGDVLQNDVQLKENLKKLEELVTAQAASDADLRDKLRMLEEVVTGHGLAIRDGVNLAAATADLPTGHLDVLEGKVQREIGRIEAMIREIQAEKIHARLAEMQSSMGAMGDGIQRRFEAIESVDGHGRLTLSRPAGRLWNQLCLNKGQHSRLRRRLGPNNSRSRRLLGRNHSSSNSRRNSSNSNNSRSSSITATGTESHNDRSSTTKWRSRM